MEEDILEILNGNSKLYEDSKKNIGTCQDCGQYFTQGFYLNKKTGEKIFNKYKYCPKCRNIIKKEGAATKNVSIKYQPYEWQKKVHASKARFKVVSGGARIGKDRCYTIVRRAFSSDERRRLQGYGFIIGMYISSETGRITEVDFDFVTFNPFATIPVSVYRQIETQLKENVWFVPTEYGKGLNYIYLWWRYDF